MIGQHTSTRALGGAEGYRRLARLVVRLFYSGECPPRDAETPASTEGLPPSAPAPRVNKLPKHTYEGLGVLLIDFMASSDKDEYIDEIDIATGLRLGQKNIRKALRYLETEHVVSSATVKYSLKRKNVETPDDPEIEERRRQETHVFWCIDYPRMLESLQLRLHKTKEMLRKGVEGAEALQRYMCPRCGATFSSLDALALLDHLDGVFRCEHCRAELQEHLRGPSAGGAAAAAGASRRERQNFYKGLQARLETQLKPLLEQLERLRGVAPPDFGSLADWWQSKKEEQARRAKRLEAARRKLAESGNLEGLTEEQIAEFAERADIVVNLAGEGGEGPSGADYAPGRELPVWFRALGENGEAAGGAAGSVSVGAGGAAASEEFTAGYGATGSPTAAQQQDVLRQQQYLQQYLLQVQQMSAATGGGVDDDKKDLVKVETAAGFTVEQEIVMEDAIAAADQQMEQDVKWEDVDGVNGGGGGGDAIAGGDDDDDVEWEDAD